MTYPNTAAITTEFGSGAPDALSRPSALKHGTTVLATYKFLGLGTNVEVRYQAAGNLMLTYENGGTGDAGGQIHRAGPLWAAGGDDLENRVEHESAQHLGEWPKIVCEIMRRIF